MSEEFDAVKAFEYCREIVCDWGDYASDYFKERHGFNDDIKTIKGYIEYAKAMQAKFDEQEKELAALRSLLIDIVDCDMINDEGLYGLKLIDAEGNPTPLLTGIRK